MAGRGLDIPKLPAVVNFEPPKRAEAYIHRAGRTGRMGEPGLVVTLGDDHDRRDLKKLVPQYAIQRAYMSDGKLVTTLPARKPDNETPVTVKLPAPSQRKSRQVAAKDRPVATNEPEQKPRRKHKKKRLRDQRNKGKHKNNT